MNRANSKRFLAATFFLTGAVSLPMGMTSAQVAPAAAAPATQPGADEVQSLIDTKQYSTAVKAASKLLALRGPAAESLSRFDISMEKGYALAGMKSNSSAVNTFTAAEKETKDPNQIALAKWTAELFHTAGSATYTPKTIVLGAPKRGPFDLLNADERKDAFGALLDDNLALLDPKLKAATISQNLPQIWPVLTQVMDLDKLDLIANGTDDKTQTLASSLLDHTRNLLSNALKEDWARVSDIDTHANQTTTVPTQMYINNQLITQTISKKNGLTNDNTSELKNIISVCQKIHDAAEAFMSMAKSDKDWSTILSDSDRVAGRASDVLSADYGTTTSSSTSTGINGLEPYQQVGVQNQFPTNTNPNVPPQRSNAPSKPKTGQ